MTAAISRDSADRWGVIAFVALSLALTIVVLHETAERDRDRAALHACEAARAANLVAGPPEMTWGSP